MEGFIEQVVKRDKTAKSLAIKIIAVILLVLTPVFFVVLARMTQVYYLIMVGIFVFIFGIYFVWLVFSSQKVEYEYAVNGDMLDIAKIISLRKRKKVCSVHIREIDLLETGDREIRNRLFRKIYLAAKNPNAVDTNTFAVFKEPGYGTCVLVFNPNETILQAMKPYLNKEIVLKTFYKKKER